MSRRDGFTLLEIMLALCIALLLVTLSVPGIVGLLREQDLKKTFEEFDDFVHRAQLRSVTEHRGFRLLFEEAGVTLAPTDPNEEDATADAEHFPLEKGQTLTIERPAAMMKKPPAEWPFWRSGTCEPVIISYSGQAGSWKVQYDPLTVRGTFLEEDVK